MALQQANTIAVMDSLSEFCGKASEPRYSSNKAWVLSGGPELRDKFSQRKLKYPLSA